MRSGAEILSHSVAVDAEIGSGATVGPFCYLRPGTVLDPDSKAGAFVEIKNSGIGPRTRVPHLSYIGDADIGEDTNVGAGTITANFPHRPGEPKGRTTIGKNVRTGIQNGFVAPVKVVAAQPLDEEHRLSPPPPHVMDAVPVHVDVRHGGER